MRVANFSAAISILFCAAHAEAAPIYLACQVTDDGHTTSIDVAADEGSQVVTTSFPKGGPSARVPATFGPDTLSFPMGSAVVVTIDRTTLKIRRAMDQQIIDAGTCKLQKQPSHRAF